MNIAYLYALQNFRETVGGFLTPIMDLITKLSVSPVLLVLSALHPAAIRAVAEGTAQALRMRLPPVDTGQPNRPRRRRHRSRHGLFLPQRTHAACHKLLRLGRRPDVEKRRWVAALFIALILLTGFSRNFLGVHTPQDVVVAILETSLILFVIYRLRALLEKSRRWMCG